MKVTDIYYLERVKTTEYAFKEIKMSAVLEKGDDPSECTDVLEILVRQQLGLDSGKKVEMKTTETKPVVVAEEPAKKKVAKKVSKKVTKKTSPKEDEIPEVPTTLAEAQEALRSIAVHFKSGGKAVAIIEKVAGVKTLAECDPSHFSEIVKQSKILLK